MCPLASPVRCRIRFSYIGIQPPLGSRFDLAKAESGERESLFESQLEVGSGSYFFMSMGRDMRKM